MIKQREANSESHFSNVFYRVIALLRQNELIFTVDGFMALLLQKVSLQHSTSYFPIRIAVQWDCFEDLQQLFPPESKDRIFTDENESAYRKKIEQIPFEFCCTYGTVLRTDPDRMILSTDRGGYPVYCLDHFLRTRHADDPLRRAVQIHLKKLQQSNALLNGRAWNEEAFQAWIQRFGAPEEAADKIVRRPLASLGSLAPYFSDTELNGKKIINLLGSNGRKAIALAKLGAEVSVIDISAENAEYARKTAAAAGVPLNYIVSDVFSLPEEQRPDPADFLFMELGIVHYFIDLEPLAALVERLLKPGGRMILQDFHPVSVKLVTTRGKRQVVFGNYFDKKMIERKVAYSKHLNDEKNRPLVQNVYLKEWTVGEIVTAFAQAGLIVKQLDESPNMKIADIGLPKLFTLVCDKMKSC